MGRLETHELVPGGKAIAVTNENKYVRVDVHLRYLLLYKYFLLELKAYIYGVCMFEKLYLTDSHIISDYYIFLTTSASFLSLAIVIFHFKRSKCFLTSKNVYSITGN